jgi:hypothetical protein
MCIVNRAVPEESSIQRRASHTIIVEQRFAAAAGDAALGATSFRRFARTEAAVT